MKHLWLVVLVAAHSLAAQSLVPGTRVAITPESRLQLDSMAWRSIAQHTEQAACVTSAMVKDSAYIIVAIKPARNIAVADSVKLAVTGPMCEWWQPMIHSHILDNGWLEIPSPVDYLTTAQRGVFGFLISVQKDSSWKLRAYP